MAKRIGGVMSHRDILWVEKWVVIQDIRSVRTFCDACFLEQRWDKEKHKAFRQAGRPLERQ